MQKQIQINQPNPPPLQLTTIEHNLLEQGGFTNSGIQNFEKTVIDYSSILLEKANTYAEIDKAPNSIIEITHDHVRKAAYSIAVSYGKPIKPKWLLFAQIGQYIGAAGCGFCGGFLNQTKGLIGFVCFFIIGGILFVLEKNNSN